MKKKQLVTLVMALFMVLSVVTPQMFAKNESVPTSVNAASPKANQKKLANYLKKKGKKSGNTYTITKSVTIDRAVVDPEAHGSDRSFGKLVAKTTISYNKKSKNFTFKNTQYLLFNKWEKVKQTDTEEDGYYDEDDNWIVTDTQTYTWYEYQQTNKTYKKRASTVTMTFKENAKTATVKIKEGKKTKTAKITIAKIDSKARKTDNKLKYDKTLLHYALYAWNTTVAKAKVSLKSIGFKKYDVKTLNGDYFPYTLVW